MLAASDDDPRNTTYDAKVAGAGGSQRQGWAGPQHEDWPKQAAQQQVSEDLHDTAASNLSQNTTANAEEAQQFCATQPQVNSMLGMMRERLTLFV
jgi:hypothetical protein